MLLFQLNVLTSSQLNVLRLIQLIYYGGAQLNLILSVNLKQLLYDSGIQILNVHSSMIQYNKLCFNVTLIHS